ncbi:hypothetical protein XELAEV_18039666mg [Xenopus laevis]|uniref:G-protein coupled receptors family 1 profile domain-containing protein n=1 Tax=Xenopus laevis TaxID=8355 RepID=A0A974C8N4_XENLA|nr:hypothetical protein XELAEV_18039666mg [Xenopus laevis]
MELNPCSTSQIIQSNNSIVPSSLLFAAGLLGNLITLYIPQTTCQEDFCFLCPGNCTNSNQSDGKILLCPVVQVAYFKNQSLVAMTDSLHLCKVFSFFMIFFSLAQKFILLAMAVDCWLALGYPFFYEDKITKKLALVVSLVVYVFIIGFALYLLFGFGRYKQYCPGTWCFIQMMAEESTTGVLAYSMLYGTTMEPAGMEELEHLILLVIMTVLFAICSLPVTARVYVGAFKAEKNEYADRTVLRLLSVNSTLILGFSSSVELLNAVVI